MQRSVSSHIPQRIDSIAHVYFERRVQQTAECSNDSHHSCICIIICIICIILLCQRHDSCSAAAAAMHWSAA